MAADSTFGQLWRRLLVWAPELPAPLAQELINTAYSRTLAAYDWSGKRGEFSFFVPPTYNTGTISVTQDSPTITGSGTTWTSAMVGRQIFISNKSPIYTILAVGGPTTLTIDADYPGLNASGLSYSIDLVYIEPPADFESWEDIYDPDNRWRLYLLYQQKHFDLWDASRTAVGGPWAVGAASFSSTGVPRYELWPRLSGSTGRTYGSRYIKTIPLLSAESDRPIFPIRGDVLREAAMAELALWKGSEQRQSEAYDPGVAQVRERRYITELNKLEVVDQNINQTRINYAAWEKWPYPPLDSKYWQSASWIV